MLREKAIEKPLKWCMHTRTSQEDELGVSACVRACVCVRARAVSLSGCNGGVTGVVKGRRASLCV